MKLIQKEKKKQMRNDNTTSYDAANTINAVQNYKEKNWSILPIQYQHKNPLIPNWNQRMVDDCFPEREFSDPQNVGVILGDNSDGLTDIDIDNSIALKLAPYFFPETGIIFGRKSNPSSHKLYKTQTEPSFTKLSHPSLGTIIEIRRNGLQTVCPPSIHPSGEVIKFEKFDDPLEIDIEVLESSAKRTAAASLLVGYWNEGLRHDLTLAVSGLLLKSPQWSANEIEEFIRAIGVRLVCNSLSG